MAELWSRFKRALKSLKREVVVLSLVLRYEDTPVIAKIVGWLTLLYALSPIDLIPDFVPVLGYLDDLLLVPLGIWLTYQLIPAAIIERARKQAKDEHREGKKLPKDRRGLILVACIWLVILIWSYFACQWLVSGFFATDQR